MDLALQDLAVDYPLLNAFWTMCLLFLWILWFMLLFRVISDIFRDDSLSGWGKTGWLVFACVLPFLGVFVYVVARGRGMGERDVRQARKRDEEFRSYVREAAAPNTSDDLAQLADLKAQGHLTNDEYEQAKAKILA
ncbi:SHOCT domain-containing protein [Kitasatospora sp. CMC57]|uniref:SHOCT domain-containing protein n=1 Tax=Kitasatospora sp. CMC57 TaxID=3231513 RepID=A0AB33K415_9ACTN